MFANCKIISVNTDSDDYHTAKQSAKRGSAEFPMSPSALKAFEHCPRRWVDGYESPESDAKDFGSLVDCLFLTPDQFITKYAIKPETYVNEDEETKPWNGNAKVCKKWLEDHSRFNVISAGELSDAKKAVARLMADETISAYHSACDFQVLIRGEWHDKSGIVIPVECLIDLWPKVESEFASTLADLKCIRNGSTDKFKRQVHQFGWHTQAAFDLDMAVAATGEDRNSWCIVGVENYAPFQPTKKLLDSNFIDIGRAEYRHQLARYARSVKTGNWDDYDAADNVQGWSIVAAEPWMQFQGQMDAMESAQREETESYEMEEIVP